MKRLFVGSLPSSTTEANIEALFAEYGTVHSVSLVKDMFSGQCKGFGFLEMEGHEARAAIAGLDGKDYQGKPLKVRFEQVKGKGGGRGRRR